jgi:hypothetical protein
MLHKQSLYVGKYCVIEAVSGQGVRITLFSAKSGGWNPQFETHSVAEVSQQ